MPGIISAPEGYPEWIIRYIGGDGVDATTSAGVTLGRGAVNSRHPLGR